MRGMMAALVDKSRQVDGVPTSLKELGYLSVGMDDGWCVDVPSVPFSLSFSLVLRPSFSFSQAAVQLFDASGALPTQRHQRLVLGGRLPWRQVHVSWCRWDATGGHDPFP